MRALQLYAGPKALATIAKDGLTPQQVHSIAAAAGGPKGLILGPLDRFLFGEWLADSQHPVDLIGASIGAWRMSTACLAEPVQAFERLEHDYIHQHYETTPDRKRPSADSVSDAFGSTLAAFYEGRVPEILQHPRYRLHIVTSHGRHLLHNENRWRTPLGYLGAYLSNMVQRRAMGAWLERVVFSSPALSPLPFDSSDYPTRQVSLTELNFHAALQASCSIPFVLRAIHDIPGAPAGAYWDGGITDYHLHLNYAAARAQGIVLYPHFQKSVVPGWLDKRLTRRHRATPFLDTMLLLSPRADWVASLPNAKLPDRTDFTHYGNDLGARVRAWSAATAASVQLADEFAEWLHRPDPRQVLPL
jgi:hypothetical protein